MQMLVVAVFRILCSLFVTAVVIQRLKKERVPYILYMMGSMQHVQFL